MKSLSLSQPHLLIMVGIPGSGKSFFAQKFSDTFHAPCINYDTITDLAGSNSDIGSKYAIYLLKELFKTGHTIIFDGPAGTHSERVELKNLAIAAGYKPLLIWVQTDESTAKTRFVKESKKNNRHVTASHYDAIAREFTAPTPTERPVVVISGKHTYATQAKAVLKNLASTKQTARSEELEERPLLPGSKRNITVR